MITVNFGTCAQDTAVTIFAPWRAMPSFSYLRPTMKPVMFCRNTSGTLRWQHSSMKCAPFCALSENRMPLLATMPTGIPSIQAKPVTSVLPSATSTRRTRAVDDAADHLANVVRLARVGRDHAVQVLRVELRRPRVAQQLRRRFT